MPNTITINKPYKGLNKDTHPLDQEEGFLSFALNAVNDSHEGDKIALSNEPGNAFCALLPTNSRIIGTIYGENNQTYIFSTDNITSRIGVLKECIYENIVETPCLGFTTNNLITGVYKVKNGCDRYIFWQDGANDDRFLNIDDLDSFKTNDDWDCNKFKFIGDVTYPNIDIVQVNDNGGNIPVGSYLFQIDILDGQLNLIYRSYISPSIPIYGSDISDNYFSIQGKQDLDNAEALVGGIPNTNKSIDLQFTNIDTDYNFIRINVFYYDTSNGITKQAHTVGTLLPITSDTINYTYTGLNASDGDTLVDADELTTPMVKYKSSKVMTQVQNRLVRANVIQDTRDYSKYQRDVNNITSQFTVNQNTVFDQNTLGNPRNPLSYIDNLSFMGDEIYAFGIVYIYDDGTESPAFHIPGRAKISGLDDVSIAYDATNPDLKHLPVQTSYETWEVYNTANINGRMSYYESELTYPTIKDCDGEFIFGDLAGEKIRHHKFPCRRLIPIYTTDNVSFVAINRLGIEFDNITYPDSDIVSHRFVYVKRDNNTKTVLDTGYLASTFPWQPGAIPNTDPNDPYNAGPTDTPLNPAADVVQFYSPKSLTGEYLNGDHFKQLGALTETSTIANAVQSFKMSGSNAEFDIDIAFSEYIQTPILPSGANTYCSYNTNIFIKPRTLQSTTSNISGSIFNSSYSNTVNIYHLIDPTNSQNALIQVANKRYTRPYNNLDSLVYSITHNKPLTLTDSQNVTAGDVFITELSIFNIDIADRDSFFTGGLFENDVRVIGNYVNRLWVESEVNYELVHAGEQCNIRYISGESATEYTIQKIADRQDDNEWLPKQFICEEFYGYNPDLSKVDNPYKYISIPQTFDYCNECIGEEKTKIIYSPKAFSAELTESYRINKVEDNIELPLHRGEITGIKYKNNQLIVHTQDTTYLLQPNPQVIQTDQNTAYLSSGDFLGIPETELIQTDTGYGGTTSKFSTCNNEYGYVWIDQKAGKVFNLGNKIDEISLKNLEKWFLSNLPSKLNNVVRGLTGEDYRNDDNTIIGVGVQTVFDPVFKRLIIHKRDFEPLTAPVLYDSNNTYDVETFVFNQSNQQFAVVQGNSYAPKSIGDVNYFSNASFTISYSYLTQSWISWHSYLPYFMFFNKNNFLTVDGNTIYKHLDKDNYTNYYGIAFPYILEYVNNDKYQTNNLDSLHYITYATKDNLELPEITFNQFMIYNNKENTGLLAGLYVDQNVNPYVQVGLSQGTVSNVRTNEVYKVNGIFDYSTTNPVTSSAWTDINGFFNVSGSTHGYIDLVPINIDYTKSPYTIKEINDKYAYVRYVYNPVDKNVKLSAYLFLASNMKSIR